MNELDIVARKVRVGGKSLGKRLSKKFDDFVKLAKQIEDINKQIEILTTQYSELEKELMPIVKETENQMIQVGNALIKYKERKVTSVSYKSAFERALEVVNEEIRKLLEEYKESVTKKGIKQYLKVEGIMNKIFDWVKDVVSELWNRLRGLKKAVNNLVSLAYKEESNCKNIVRRLLEGERIEAISSKMKIYVQYLKDAYEKNDIYFLNDTIEDIRKNGYDLDTILKLADDQSLSDWVYKNAD